MSATLTTGERMPEFGPVLIPIGSLLRWGAGAADFSEIHHDDAAAQQRGLASAVVHGPLQVSVLRRLALRWLGTQAELAELRATFLSPAPVAEPLTFAGEVTGVAEGPGGLQALDCRLWAQRPDGTVTVQAQVRVHRSDDPPGALPLERLRRALHLGEIAGTFTYPVHQTDLHSFAVAHGRAPDPDGRAPTTYFGALDPVERRDLDLDGFLEELPFTKTGGGNAFNEVTYLRPICAGDRITVTTRYTEVYEKPGSRGTLLFRVRESELRDETGALVATTRCGHVLGFDLTEAV